MDLEQGRPKHHLAVPNFSELTDAVIETLRYANVFDFPLTALEVHRFLIGKAAERGDVAHVLEQCVASGQLTVQHGFYALPDRGDLVVQRRSRTVNAEQMWQDAMHYGQQISRIPFVRMVAVTGSLAANNPDDSADIDFLIVTANNRLWLCRLLVIAIVRRAAKKGVHLCPNYFLTERALSLADKTLYSARELAQMVPIYGNAVYQKMLTLNAWIDDWLPNARVIASGLTEARAPLDSNKGWYEQQLNGSMGQSLEVWERRRKVALFTERSESAETRFSPDQCKGHFDQHQQRILSRFVTDNKS